LIIDGHTHLCGQPHTQEPVIWRIVEGGSFTAPFTRAEGKADLLLRDMDERGVDKAVVMGFLDQISNEQLSELMRELPERIIGFAGVADPKSEDSVTMLKEAVGELGLRGLKLHPDLHSFSPADPEIVPLIRCAAELDVPVLIHCYPGGMVRGYFNLNTPGHMDTLKRRVPEATIIVGHMAWPRYLDLIAIGQIPGVYVETSWGLTSIAELNGTAYTSRLLRMIGIDNIVFGSDWCSVQIGMEQERQIRLIESLDLTREEKDKILGGNMGRVLNL
jgi:predicted TIM-barrel fold metal-dependent hydrolase